MNIKFSMVVNYLLGIFGVFVLTAGFIVTTGGLNLMHVNEKYTVAAGDVFQAMVYPILLILLPCVLIKHTLGRYVGFFNFSAKVIMFLFVFTSFTKLIAEVGKTYNFFVYMDEKISQDYADIDLVYKKKMDLTSSVEKVFYDYMDYESTTLTNISSARSSYFDAQSVDAKVSAANVFDQNVKTLIISMGSYPELKANENINKYVNLMESSENELVSMKRSYNQKVQKYNSQYKEFPTVFIVRAANFELKTYFEENGSVVEGMFDIRY